MTAAAQLQFKTTMHALIVNSLTDYENALKLSLHQYEDKKLSYLNTMKIPHKQEYEHLSHLNWERIKLNQEG